MKFFGRQDELFEIMAQATAKRRAETTGGDTPTPGSLAAQPSALRPSPISSGYARRGSEPEPDLLEVDGEAVVVVEDEWEGFLAEGGDALLEGGGEDTEVVGVASGASGVFGRGGFLALRTDTAIVGGILLAGLIATAFLLGRTSGGEADPASAEVAAAAPSEPGPEVEPEPAPTLPASIGPVAAADGPSAAGSSVAAGAARGEETTVAASSPRRVTDGRYSIQVCTTTSRKAADLARWLNEEARSPIFGRSDLEAYARGGSVRIRGFASREEDVLARVKATADPTGGSGTFGDAYYVATR